MPFDQNSHADLLAVQAWLDHHGLAAANAARLLAGATAAEGVHRLISDLREASALSRLMRTRLHTLHRLLSLEDADDAPFPSMLPLHPADPRVMEICLLADSLAALVEDIGLPPAVAA
ncbi:hypothetical protein ORIO_04485 [Cereibacter azotoformans]|uniref:hypothetical protein n=1 Tax=Cereibacter azotoformans TaxID=43057 RepID=UPI001EE9EC77|nr:hypothetical protein [Cereibacter azotoformans]ULB09182.1 hypothetical protein ORIO_04485 [Cereibacter azotoformans]